MSRTEVLILDQTVSDNSEGNQTEKKLKNCQSQKYQFFTLIYTLLYEFTG